MKKTLYILSLLLVVAMALTACGLVTIPPITLQTTPPANNTADDTADTGDSDLLFVAINKSADQQYFIDLQNSFVETSQGFGAEALKYDAKLDSEPRCDPD